MPTVRTLTHQGITRSFSEWSRETGLDRQLIMYRLSVGWPVAMALTYPVRTERDGTPGRSAVYVDDRVGPRDRVVAVYPTDAEARAEAKRRNAELIAGGADPWKAPLYYVFVGRNEEGEDD